MKLFGETTTTTIELPEELQFVLVREAGWVDSLAGPVVFTLMLGIACFYHRWMFLLFALLGFGYLIANYLNGPVTKIFVSADGFSVSGNLGLAFTTELHVRADEIQTLDFGNGSEDEKRGLYLNGTTFLAAMDEDEARTILCAVRRKFPLLERGDASPASVLHGDESGVTTLRLTKRPGR